MEIIVVAHLGGIRRVMGFLDNPGLESGLRIPDVTGDGLRERILKDQISKIEKKWLRVGP